MSNDKLVEALEAAGTALDDWMGIYAPECCDEAMIVDAWDRVRAEGGTLCYIATVRQKVRDALAAVATGYWHRLHAWRRGECPRCGTRLQWWVEDPGSKWCPHCDDDPDA